MLIFPLSDGQGNQTTTGSLDLVVFTVASERGFSRSPLLGSALIEVCSEIPGAMASSLIDISTCLVKAGGTPQRTPPPNPGTFTLYGA